LLRKALGRDLTDVELACFENLWSEHCSYRSTRPLLRTLPTAGSEVLLGPGDDAAIVRFSDTCALAIGMESHNHPSYVDPYDGAATGVGGIVRDLVGDGRVTAATDLSRGGLLAALVKVAPGSDVTLAGDPLEELFAETYGRFLVAVGDESALAGVEHRIVGKVGGDRLTLRLKDGTVVIAPGELEAALTATTRRMRY